MEDPDAPSGTFYHWIKFNIKVSSSSYAIKENEEVFGISGKGTGNNLKYFSPCPPSGTHRYYFKVYALDTKLNLTEGITAKDLINGMQNHILAHGELMGLYKKINPVK